jgi:hypothetical protein
MRVIGGWLSFLLSVFLFVAFLAGVFIQLSTSFYAGTGIVLLSLGIELMREMSKREKRRKFRWRDIIGLSIGASISIAALLISLLLALVLEQKAWYILLLDSALSTMVFLSNSFLRFWGYLRK